MLKMCEVYLRSLLGNKKDREWLSTDSSFH